MKYKTFSFVTTLQQFKLEHFKCDHLKVDNFKFDQLKFYNSNFFIVVCINQLGKLTILFKIYIRILNKCYFLYTTVVLNV